MTENTQIPAAQNIIQDPPEYNAENAKNPKEGSDWLGGPQNGNESPSEADYTKHRFDETNNQSTEGAYQQNGQSWLGGPQNGNETPGKPKVKSDASDYIGQNLLAALQNAKLQADLIGDLVNLTQSWVNGDIDDAGYSEQLREYGMAIG